MEKSWNLRGTHPWCDAVTGDWGQIWVGFGLQSLLERVLQTIHPLEKIWSVPILTYATALVGVFQTKVLERSGGGVKSAMVTAGQNHIVQSPGSFWKITHCCLSVGVSTEPGRCHKKNVQPRPSDSWWFMLIWSWIPSRAVNLPVWQLTLSLMQKAQQILKRINSKKPYSDTS